MKNIAIITSCLSKGGAERAAGLLSISLSKRYNVYLFLISRNEINYSYKGKIKCICMNEHYDKWMNSKFPFKNLLAKSSYIKAVRDLKKLKKAYKIDCAISFLETPNLMNIFSNCGEKIIVSVRNNRSLQTGTTIQRIENYGIKKYYNRTNAVVSLSYGVSNDLVKNFQISPKLVKTIYNFFDFESIRYKANMPLPQEFESLFGTQRVIMTMGRLVPQKNYFNLLLQIKKLFEEVNDTILVIFGTGEQKNSILKYIESNQLSKKVFLFDYCENPFPMLKRADIFIMNSIFEGFCNSIVEAMACNTMVISTDCLSGPREIIAGIQEYESKIESFELYDRGILVPVNKEFELMKAIKYALSDDIYRDKCVTNGSKFIDSFANEKIENEWYRVIEELV